jgi:hypothetical protein
MMTPLDGRWPEFIERLEGPGGCNFREGPGNGTWDCDNTSQRPIARRILAQMGLAPAEIEQSLGYFSAHGGMCDCEIVFNVKGSVDHMFGRDVSRLFGGDVSRRRKNPR